MCHEANFFKLIFCLDDLSTDLSMVLKSLTSFISCPYLPLCLLMFALCMYVLLCWVHRYLQVLYPLAGSIPLFLCDVLLYLLLQSFFKVYFVYYYPSFLKISIFMGYLFLSLHFTLCFSLDLRSVSCRQHIYGSFFFFLMHSLPYVF